MEISRNKPKHLLQMAEARGMSVAELVTTAIEEHGTLRKAAAALGVHKNALSHHIKANRLEVQTRQVARVIPKDD